MKMTDSRNEPIRPSDKQHLHGKDEFMFLKKNIKGLSVSLLMACVLLAGAGLLIAQSGSDVWKDDATGLTWAGKDNGMAITPSEGRSYCDALKTGGLKWRLPTIDEVEGIFDSKEKKQYKTKGTIELSDACVLTSSTNRSGDAFTFCFNSGSRNIGGGGGCGTTSLALCVSGESKQAANGLVLDPERRIIVRNESGNLNVSSPSRTPFFYRDWAE